MSWSVSCIGKPENVIKHLTAYGETLSGMSKEEFDAAKPNIIALLGQNYHNQANVETPLINFSASGSGYKADLVESRTCAIKIETMYAKLV